MYIPVYIYPSRFLLTGRRTTKIDDEHDRHDRMKFLSV